MGKLLSLIGILELEEQSTVIEALMPEGVGKDLVIEIVLVVSALYCHKNFHFQHRKLHH